MSINSESKAIIYSFDPYAIAHSEIQIHLEKRINPNSHIYIINDRSSRRRSQHFHFHKRLAVESQSPSTSNRQRISRTKQKTANDRKVKNTQLIPIGYEFIAIGRFANVESME